MVRTVCLVLCAVFSALGITPAIAEVAIRGNIQASEVRNAWVMLHDLEVVALRTYQHHLPTDAEQVGAKLWDVAHSPDLAELPSCGRAAETLSYMVLGFASSARRVEIAMDWHHFAPRYAEHRHACLSTLKVNAGEFPLPRWFGR